MTPRFPESKNHLLRIRGAPNARIILAGARARARNEYREGTMKNNIDREKRRVILVVKSLLASLCRVRKQRSRGTDARSLARSRLHPLQAPRWGGWAGG